jgi:putative ABC transport system ATP-binding protein
LQVPREDVTVDALIEISDVTKRYEGATAAAVNAVSLEIGEGEAVAVMGHSGSRKSTLLNLIAGLDRPARGVGAPD